MQRKECTSSLPASSCWFHVLCLASRAAKGASVGYVLTDAERMRVLTDFYNVATSESGRGKPAGPISCGLVEVRPF